MQHSPSDCPREHDAQAHGWAERCHYCGYGPAAARLGGYCSWDCHDHAGDEPHRQQRDAA